MFACNSNDDEVQPDIIDNPQFTIDEFPLSIGNQWVYERTNENTFIVDTVVLKIVDKIFQGEDSVAYKLNMEKGLELIDSSLFIQSNNFLIYENLSPTARQIINFRLKFPLYSGDSWIGEDPIDTVKVDSTGLNFNLNGNSYEKVFILNRSAFYFPDGSRNNQIIISPDIGLISFEYSEFINPIFLSKKFRLISYNLTEN